jgi:two-component system NtrC family sensor kinase
MVASAGFAALGVLAFGTTGLSNALALGLVLYGVATGWLARQNPRSWPPVLASHVVVLTTLATAPLSLSATALIAVAILVALAAGATSLGQAKTMTVLQDSEENPLTRVSRERDEIAEQLNRRINQIFSLQELSYVLSESMQEDRIANQVASYAARFLQTQGAAVLLVEEGHDDMRVAAAEGSLATLAGSRIIENPDSLVTKAVGAERLEMASALPDQPLLLVDGHEVQAAAVAPLRAHGVTMGAIAVTDKESGEFTDEDRWLLSTVATQTAVVLANSRFFEMFRRGKEEWETTFDALTESIAIIDQQGQLRRVNRALSRLVGVPEPTLIGRPLIDLVFGESHGPIDVIEATRRKERPHAEVIRSETLQRTLRVTAATLPDGGHTVGNIVVLLEDVTEQRALEAQLIQNEKMAALGQLVSGVAHELNNPLTSISGLSEFLLEPGRLPESHTEHLRIVNEQAERAGRIVQNLLTFARKGEPETAEVDINRLAQRTLRLVEHELTLNGITLERHLTNSSVVIRGDQHELQQVLLNLLTNAIHSLSDLPEGEPRTIRLETGREGAKVIILLCDNGPGVPEELIGRLFTPFFTTKDPGRGTGLGLSISYGIVKSHAGTVVYDPPPDKGAGFRITLPTAGSGPRARISAPEKMIRRILVVDQDRAIARVLVASLTGDGVQVETVETGDEAWSKLLSDAFDLVIVEAHATLEDGRRLAVALCDQEVIVPARIFVAVPESDETSGEVIGQGDVTLVTKPFDLKRLRQLVTSVLDGS